MLDHEHLSPILKGKSVNKVLHHRISKEIVSFHFSQVVGVLDPD